MRPDYPFEDFISDYADFYTIVRESVAEEFPGKGPGEELPVAFVMTLMFRFIREKYGGTRPVNEIAYRATRFYLISSYVASHIHDFDREDFAVYGSEAVGALVNDHLFKAIHHIVTSCEEADVDVELQPGKIMKLAATYREAPVTGDS